MHVAFLVIRRSYVKHFAGAVEEALARGWRVTLLCDHRGVESQATGWKGYDYPRLDAMPAFARGVPAVVAFTSVEELDGLLRGGGIQALFVAGARPIVAEIRRRCPALLIAQIQSAWDALMLHVTPQTLPLFDAIYGPREHERSARLGAPGGRPEQAPARPPRRRAGPTMRALRAFR